MPDWVRDWVPLASSLCMVIGILVTLLHRAPIVPASRVSTLRQNIAEQSAQMSNLRSELSDARQEIRELKDALKEATQQWQGRLDSALYEKEYWRKKFEALERQRS
jgi:FtsZ-binding cell division protein ZapB